jgi:hypothetical protein
MLQLELAKKELESERVVAKKELEWERAVAKKGLEWKDVLAKKELEWKDVLAKKDVELAILNEKLKTSNLETLILRESYSIRAAIEILLLKHYPQRPRKMEDKLLKYWSEEPKLRETYSSLCQKLNCSDYWEKVPSKVYHSLSSGIHGGGYPIRCHINDSSLSPAEWSFIISVLKLNLPKDGYMVFDMEGNEMDI